MTAIVCLFASAVGVVMVIAEALAVRPDRRGWALLWGAGAVGFLLVGLYGPTGLLM